MENKLVSYIKSKLGITQLEEKVKDLEIENKSLKSNNKDVLREVNKVRDVVGNVLEDNSLIKNHLRLINKDFMVYSDISPHVYDPNVVLVVKRGSQETMKSYRFDNDAIQEIYRMLEGFGEENNMIDKPRHMRGPKFRY